MDCAFADGIADARLVEELFSSSPGVVDTGLFLGMPTTIIVAGDDVDVIG